MCDVLFVCRNGLSLDPTLHTIRNVQSVSSPLRFHVFYDRQPRPPPPDNVSVAFYDTSEARLWSRLSPTAWSWHQQFRRHFAKAHSYAAVKLFCVELLPTSVERVVIMDTDVVPLVDVAELMGWYAAVAGSDANVVVAYAQESVHFYEAVLRKGSPRKTRAWASTAASPSTTWRACARRPGGGTTPPCASCSSPRRRRSSCTRRTCTPRRTRSTPSPCSVGTRPF